MAAHGDTKEEALEEIKRVVKDVVTTTEEGHQLKLDEIPKPINWETHYFCAAPDHHNFRGMFATKAEAIASLGGKGGNVAECLFIGMDDIGDEVMIGLENIVLFTNHTFLENIDISKNTSTDCKYSVRDKLGLAVKNTLRELGYLTEEGCLVLLGSLEQIGEGVTC